MTRIDLRGVIFLIVLLSVFYWLMLPGPNHHVTTTRLDRIHNHRVHVKAEHKEGDKETAVVEVEKSKVAELKEKNAGLLAELNKLKSEYKLLKETQSEEKENLQVLSSELSADLKKAQSEVKTSQEDLKKQKYILAGKTQFFQDVDKKIKDISVENENLLKENNKLKSKDETTTKPFTGLKIVHFDLKGAPPKIDYFIKTMLFMKKLGAQGFLIEYEDMFPWSGDISELAAKNSYSLEDIKRIVDTAHKEDLAVIPLVQTFGHLEFALKHDTFKSLRETKEISNSVCPLNNATLPFLENIIRQVQSAHPHSKWLHLGGDEVWNIKTCDRCRQSKLTAAKLFIQHIQSIAEFTKTLKTVNGESVSPIIWDDMMRSWSVEELKAMSAHITPMVWAYAAKLENYRNFPNDMWQKYTNSFKSIWLASSFKGALKAWSDFVPIRQHLDNHLSWLKITTELQSSDIKVDGIALTGWSRYDHYGPLCELLPAGIPSLAVCLAVLKQGSFNEKLHKEVSEKLGFNTTFKIDIARFNKYLPESATFKGADVYNLVGKLERSLGWKAWSDSRAIGWTRPYHVKRNHLGYYHLNASMSALTESKETIEQISTEARAVLSKYFDKSTVDEWTQDKLDYQIADIKKSYEHVKDILEMHTFL